METETKTITISSAAEMQEFGQKFAKTLSVPAVLELVGDVGVGKTTFTQGLASGLGVREPITSPSFTISKRYAIRHSALDHQQRQSTTIDQENQTLPTSELVHYDFYRLSDPGIMREELAETLAGKNVVVIEWGEEVAALLPPHKQRLEFSLCEDGSRKIKISL